MSLFRSLVDLKFMNAVFKIGKNKKVYFLYCRRLIFRSTELVEKESTKNIIAQEYQNAALERLPNFVMNSAAVVKHQSTDLRANFRCQLCKAMINKAEACGLKMKYLLGNIDLDPVDNRVKIERENDLVFANPDRMQREAAMEEKYDIVHFRPEDVKNPDNIRIKKAEKRGVLCIPPLIESLFPNMTKKVFDQIRDKTHLQESVLQVCSSCFVKNSEIGRPESRSKAKPTATENEGSKKAVKLASQDKGLKVKYINQVRSLERELRSERSHQGGCGP